MAILISAQTNAEIPHEEGKIRGCHVLEVGKAYILSISSKNMANIGDIVRILFFTPSGPIRRPVLGLLHPELRFAYVHAGAGERFEQTTCVHDEEPYKRLKSKATRRLPTAYCPWRDM